jgi:hypothetical protein
MGVIGFPIKGDLRLEEIKHSKGLELEPTRSWNQSHHGAWNRNDR